MRHSLWLYSRRDGERTLHWKPGCPLGIGGHRDRLIEFDRGWQASRGWRDDDRPELLVAGVADAWDAAICVHCFPESVLLSLGLPYDPRRRSGEPLQVA